jgi:hypothetical protein
MFNLINISRQLRTFCPRLREICTFLNGMCKTLEEVASLIDNNHENDQENMEESQAGPSIRPPPAFTCGVDGCTAQYTNRSNRNRHIRDSHLPRRRQLRRGYRRME